MTTTGISTGLPASDSLGVYVTFPVFSSMLAPFGALSPSLYFVPSGAFVSFPSASLNVGASVIAGVPALPSLSAYTGVSLSAVVCAGVVSLY